MGIYVLIRIKNNMPFNIVGTFSSNELAEEMIDYLREKYSDNEAIRYKVEYFNLDER